MQPQQIKEKIESSLKGAKAEILDPQNDGVHLKAIVTWSGFENMPMLEQHRAVMNLFEAELKEELHALALETKVN